ncbi:MAG: hypothetical protein QOH55_1727 [Microbacteriaceae bacterium]|jgi:hypothetical protein|nr:hypothetical protein [Microbacteriaceae bacterium]
MQDLKVIGVENGALLAASDSGERYRIAIDEVLQSRLRQSRTESNANSPKLSPREVQAHIRAGMSAEDVATITGASIEYIQRFEGPILAEREHMVASALSVPVHTAAEVDPLEGGTFGSVIRDRLASLGVSGERWASWKEEEGGWIVKLAFTADSIDHDARWSYDARKHALAPLNSEATTLSQQGELQGGALIPRLRAVAPHTSETDESRFDSGAFTFRDLSNDLVGPDTIPHLEPIAYGRSTSAANNSITVSAIKRSNDEGPKDTHQTADLLEALRRRRGERESASYEDQPPQAGTSQADNGVRVVDVPLDDFAQVDDFARAAEPPRESAAAAAAPQQRQAKKGRASMPSWDEIVFGARSDDDPA